MNWLPLEEYTPPFDVPLIFVGNSGYVPPHHIRIISGYRRENYADGSMHLVDTAGDALTDSGPAPTHFCYRIEIEDELL